MYRHNALSIKETSDKMFVSSEEKQKISEISNIQDDVIELRAQYNKLESANKPSYEDLQGTQIHMSVAKEDIITNIEVLGNTIQDSNDSSDVKFVGKLKEDGNYEIKLKSCGKNIFDINKPFDCTYGNEFGRDVIILENNQITTSGLKGVESSKSQFYNFKPNTTYTFSATAVLANIIVRIYNQDTKYNIAEAVFPCGVRHSVTFNTSNISKGNVLILFHRETNVENAGLIDWQIEEGGLTEYENHQSHVNNINLPIQLKKVDNLHDRLFRREDGVWCIEKNIGEGVLDHNLPYNDMNINDVWQKPNTSKYAVIGHFNFLPTDTTEINCVSTLASQVSYQDIIEKDVEGVGICHTDGDFLNISISKTKIGELSIKEYLKMNPIKFWYKQKPEIIELPLDTQIHLNSFFGTTNILIDSGDVDGIIKCSIPKSIGGIVDSLVKETNNISNRVANIETLQEGNNITSFTNKGYTVCINTKNGYVNDIKIEGNTLVNLCDFKDTTFTLTEGQFYDDLTVCSVDKLELNTDYTFMYNIEINNNTTNTSLGVNTDAQFGVSGGEGTQGHPVMLIDGKDTVMFVAKKRNAVLINFKEFGGYSHLSLRPILPYVRPLTAGQQLRYTISNMMLIKGNHVDKLSGYFEGIQSTGQDTDVISIISNNMNLNQYKSSDFLKKSFFNSSGTKITLNGDDWSACDKLVDVYNLEEIYVSSTHTRHYGIAHIPCYDKNGVFIGAATKGDSLIGQAHFKLQRDTRFVKICVRSEDDNVLDNIVVSPSYINQLKYQINDKKQLLYKNSKGEFIPVPALRKVGNGVSDTIEKHNDGKYYYHKRCEEIVLNGSENWQVNASTTKNKSFHIMTYPTQTANMNSNAISNRFTRKESYVSDYEGMWIDVNTILTISPSKLETPDLAGFKKWLNGNNTTIVYQLANEEVYECNDIELNSYDNETFVTIESGVICPSNLQFKTTSHIGNIVTTMKEEVDKNSKFREEITESMTIVKKSDNGFIHFEDTKEGIVSMDKIEGDTLVNELPVTGADLSIYTTTIMYHNAPIGKFKFKDNTTYTMAIFGTTSNFNGKMSIKNITGGQLTTTNFIGKFTTGVVDHSIPHQLHLYGSNFTESDKANIRAVCVEGDYTNNPPSYFEGIKSVGQLEDSVEIICNNSNLVNFRDTKKRVDSTKLDFGDNYVEVTDTNYAYISMPVPRNIDLSISAIREGSVGAISIYGEREDGGIDIPNVVYTGGNGTFNTKNNSRIRITLFSGMNTLGTCKFTNLLLNYGKDIKSYEPCTPNTSKIMFKNSNGVYEKPILRGVPNGLKDTIEKHSDGKYYYHKRCEEIVLNGSEAWGAANEGDTVNGITFYAPNTKVKNGGKCVSDKLKNLTLDTHSGKTDFVLVASGTIVINLLKSKLSSQDKEGFKAWLQQNPVTVVYELATEEIYECNNLDLSSYDGETSIIINTVIPAKVKASTSSNLLATIDSLKKRINYLETEFSDMTENGSGWCKLPNGMIMQWGVTDLSSIEYSKVCNFPISFSKNVVFTSANVIKNVTTNSSAGLSTFNVNAELMSGMSGVFIIGLPTNIGVTDTYRVTWMAMGY